MAPLPQRVRPWKPERGCHFSVSRVSAQRCWRGSLAQVQANSVRRGEVAMLHIDKFAEGRATPEQWSTQIVL